MNLQKQLLYRLGLLTGRLPYPIHAALWRGMRLAKWLPVSRLTGPTRGGGSGTVIIAGDPGPGNFVADKFFTAMPERAELGRVPPWALPGRLRRLREGSNLTVVRLDRALVKRLGFGECLLVPEFVCTAIDAMPGRRAVEAGNRNLRREAEQVRSEGFGCVETRNPAELRLFYESALRAHIHVRYGDSVPEFGAVRHAFDRGALLWVVDGEEKVGGSVVQVRGDRLLIRYSGAMRGDPGLVRRGVLTAARLNAVEYAFRRGCATVDFGGSRPWLADGVLRNKIRWRPRLDPRWVTPYAACLRWPDGDPAVAAMFREQGLICRQGDDFAFVCADGSWPPSTVPARPGEWPAGNSIDPGRAPRDPAMGRLARDGAP